MVDFAQWRNGGNTEPICGALVALFGLIVISVLNARKVKGSIFLGIVAATLAGIPLGVTKLSSFDLNLANKFRDFGEVSLFKLDIAGLFEGKSVTEAVFIIIMLVLSFSLVNMFDSMGTLMGAGRQSGLVDEKWGSHPHAGSVNGRCYLYSSRSINGNFYSYNGCRVQCRYCRRRKNRNDQSCNSSCFSGSHCVCTGSWHRTCSSNCPAPIFVGVLMLGNIKDVDFSEPTDAVASFCTIVFMPFTYSIANGMAMGLITYCLLKVFTNKAKEVEVLTSVIAVVFVFRYAFMTLG